MDRIRKRLGALVGAALALGAWGGSARAQLFQPVDLGVLPGTTDSAAFDVNEKQQVCGTLTSFGSDPMAFLWLPAPDYGLPAGMHALGTLSTVGGWSFGDALNDCGVVVGSSTSDFAVRAYAWRQGVLTDLGSIPGVPTAWSSANDINDSGFVVGSGDDSATLPIETHVLLTCAPCEPTHVCGVRDLGTLGGTYATAHGINASGQICGQSRLAAPPGQFPTRGFFASPTGVGLVDLGALPGSQQSVATALNDRPWIVGWSGVQGAFGYEERMVAWRRTNTGWQIQDLGTFQGLATNHPYAVNDDGWVVGRSYSPGTSPVPFLWTPAAGFRDLNQLLLGAPGVVLEDALGLNEAGDIAAFGYDAQGNARAFLLKRL